MFIRRTGILTCKCWMYFFVGCSKRIWQYGQRSVCLVQNPWGFCVFGWWRLVYDQRRKLGEDLPSRTCSTTTKKEVQSFLGLAYFYRDHIPSLAAIAVPLSDLTRKGLLECVQWDNPQEKVFVVLRQNLLVDQCCDCPNTSICGLGAALMQKYDGKYYHVAYGSNKLTSAGKRCSTLEKEWLAIVLSSSEFRLYLAGKPFILQADHQPLPFLNDAKFKNDLTMRWVIRYSGV